MSKWHRRGDRPVDRAREVARTCWEALATPDPRCLCNHPGLAEAIAKAAVQAGETWLAPQIAQYGPDDVVTVPEAAELVGRSVRWTYQWVAEDRERRAVIGPDQRIRVRVRDVLETVAGERRNTPPEVGR